MATFEQYRDALAEFEQAKADWLQLQSALAATARVFEGDHLPTEFYGDPADGVPFKIYPKAFSAATWPTVERITAIIGRAEIARTRLDETYSGLSDADRRGVAQPPSSPRLMGWIAR